MKSILFLLLLSGCALDQAREYQDTLAAKRDADRKAQEQATVSACTAETQQLAKEMVGNSFYFNNDDMGYNCEFPEESSKQPKAIEKLKVLSVKESEEQSSLCKYDITASGPKQEYSFTSTSSDDSKPKYGPIGCLFAKDPEKQFKFPKSWWKAIKSNQIKVGMSPEAVALVWGKPSTINASGGVYGRHEQHVYNRNGCYLYYENGKLTSWQTHD